MLREKISSQDQLKFFNSDRSSNSIINSKILFRVLMRQHPMLVGLSELSN